MDMVAIMYRRLRKGMSPFSPIVSTFTILSCAPDLPPSGVYTSITLCRRHSGGVGVAAEYSHFVPEWLCWCSFASILPLWLMH